MSEYGLAGDLASETDTEVAAALFNKMYHGDPIDCIQKTVPLLKGSFAFCIMFRGQPGQIFAVRNVSPMVAGYKKGEGSFIASDLAGFVDHTRDYFIVPEYHILRMSPEGIELSDLKGKAVKPEYLTVDWDISAAKKDGYAHYMLKEIHEQPDAINRTISGRIRENLPFFDDDGVEDSFFKGVRDITIIACGTAMYAGMVGRTFIQNRFGIPVTVAIASEFRYERPVISKETLVIVISQSGETIDSLEALRLAKKYTKKTLAIVNVKGSTIARESEAVLYTHAGPEIAVASTKAYTVQVAMMYLLGCKLGLISGRASESEIKEFVSNLKKVPELIKAMLSIEDKVAKLTGRMVNAEHAFYIGRELDYTLSMEGALKLKEISYIHAEAYAAGELKHGTIALIDEGIPVIAIASQSDVYSKVISNVREVKERGAYVILISRDSFITDNKICDVHLQIPPTIDELTVFTSIVICQLIAYYTATGKGFDPDQPRNLAKSVTVE